MVLKDRFWFGFNLLPFLLLFDIGACIHISSDVRIDTCERNTSVAVRRQA